MVPSVMEGLFSPKIQAKILTIPYRFANHFLEIIRKFLWIRKRPIQATRVCIYKIGNIGDIVCAIPSMFRIRQAYPNSHLTLLTSPGNRGMLGAKELLADADWLDEIIVYYSDEIDNKKKTIKWLRDLRKKKFDAWIELPNDLVTMKSTIRNMLLARFACKNWAYGWRINTIKWATRAQSEYLSFPNEVERNLSILARAGINGADRNFPLPIKKSHRQFVDSLFQNNGLKDSSLAALAPGAKRSTNLWPLDRFAEVGDYLVANGFQVLLLGGKNDEVLCQQIVDRMRRGGVNLAGKSSLLETSEILKRCQLLVCNDSGVQHLSSAVKTPCISIFSYRDMKGKWRPYGDQNIVLQKWVECHTCYLESCPHDNECINLIQVGEVTDAIKKRK
jgi:ADP-heptose:LPS heptosyltransferase